MKLRVFIAHQDFSCFRHVCACLNLFHCVVVRLLVDTVQPVVVDETLHGEQVLADSVWVGVLSQVFLGKVLPLIFVSQDINSLISVSVTYYV